MSDYRVIKFTEEFKGGWDDFVLHGSVNGTFLQTRNFLDYHPKGRFADASFMIYDKNRLIAAVPGCETVCEGGREFYSHKGATYGGIIIKTNYYTARRLLDIIKLIDEFLSRQYQKVTFKITADIHSVQSSDLLQYILEYCGYGSYAELNTYIDLSGMNEDILAAFDRNKVRNIRKCQAYGLYFRELKGEGEIRQFHDLLEINLGKYGSKPVHSTDEMICFQRDRIPENVKFCGVFCNEKMMAGGMLFIFEQANVIHAQNLSSDYRFKEYSPMTYLYYQLISQARADGYKALSWGISTENQGKVLNMGLIRNKESYGSRHQLNRTYFKCYSREDV